MEDVLFYSGVISGICLALGIGNLLTSRRETPFRQAFAYQMIYAFLILTITTLLQQHTDSAPNYPIQTSIECSFLPLYLLETICLVNQDLDAMSWAKRWLYTAVSALPIVLFLIPVIIYDYHGWHLTTLFVLIYGTSITCIVIYLLTRYQRMLRTIGGDKRQNIRWLWLTTTLGVIQYGLYSFYDYLPSPSIYYITEMLTFFVHSYFLYRQAPTDTTRMEQEVIRMKNENEKILQEQLQVKAEQEQALEELKEVADNVKRQSEMETTIKAFKVEYPEFENKLRNSTEARLTQRDIYLCVLICQGKRIPEIAECLSISTSSVEVARYRLRTKLGIDKGGNMKAIIKELVESKENIQNEQP